MAKSFVMMGRSRGFRVESEEGLREWSEVYSAELSASRGPSAPAHAGKESRRKKRLRKLRKRAQRRNRR